MNNKPWKTIRINSTNFLLQIISFPLVVLLIASCTPSQSTTYTPTLTPQGITEIPSTPTVPPLPTNTPSPTPEPVPTLEGLVGVPDPRITNPDFFDVSNANSPIVQFAKAFGLKPEDFAAGVHVEIKRPNNGAVPFAVLRTSNGVALMMAQQGENGVWTWQEATPGPYWYTQGKQMGLHLNWEEFRSSQQLVKNYFSYGTIVTETQILTKEIPYRPPSNARPLAIDAHNNNMSLFYTYVAEPGKFPSDVDTKNIDTWLDTRFDGFIQEVISYKTEGHPVYISFNEAWEGNVWNPEFNPIRDKYGEKWVEIYTFKFLSKFIDNGLIPNQDFVIVFNDGNMYNRPKKQDLVFNTLSQARQGAFSRLISDPVMKEKINQMGIIDAGGIQILLGTETHTKLGSNQDDATFWPAPTDEQLTLLSEKFAPLGGVIMTEVNPFGTPEEKRAFLSRMTHLLGKLPNFKGMMFWNVIKDSDDGSKQYPLSGDRLVLFDEYGSPTSLYYALLSR